MGEMGKNEIIGKQWESIKGTGSSWEWMKGNHYSFSSPSMDVTMPQLASTGMNCDF